MNGLRRAVVINNIPTPYVNALFRAISATADFDLQFLFLAKSDSNRQWKPIGHDVGFAYEVLPSAATFFRNIDLPVYVHWGLWDRLKTANPDVVCICGYHYFASLEVLAFQTRYRRPAVLWTGSHRRSGAFTNRVTDLYKRAVIRRFNSYLTYGSAAAEQIIHYGADPERIVVGCNAVEMPPAASPATPEPSDSTITRVLCVAELVRRKGVDDLIRAVAHARAQGVNVAVTVVGSGPEMDALRTLAIETQCVEYVTFLGHRPASEMAQLYRASDLFVLPSHREVWGLVVNEAMASGLPVIVSHAAGCAADLVVEGQTGFTFEAGDHLGLAACIARLANDAALRRHMHRGALERIARCDISRYAAGMIAALKLAAGAA